MYIYCVCKSLNMLCVYFYSIYTNLLIPILHQYIGGIRCVKINAYLEQKLGFGNVSRLQGGIISYAREIEALKTGGSGDESGASGSDGSATATETSASAISGSSNTILPNDRFSADFEADLINPTPTVTATSTFPIIPTPFLLTTTSNTTSSVPMTIPSRRNIPISKFRGQNYVFDERMNSAITNEILTSCETCGDSCDMFTNCGSYTCHVSIV